VFLLPIGLFKELNSLMQNFWWGHKDNKSRIHWMSWQRLGFSKTKGEMGFRDLRFFNKDLLAKQGWRLLHNPHSLAGQILKAKYFSRSSFLEAQLGGWPSYAWRSIMSSSDLIKEECVWRFGNGSDVRILGDKWFPQPTTYGIQSPPNLLPAEARVSSLIDPMTKWWNGSLVHHIFCKEEAEKF
jgi:hypothetical protein